MKIKTYYASTLTLYEKVDAYIAKLPNNLKARILNITDTDAKVCSLGGALLLGIAAKECNADIEKVVYNQEGKPYIPGSDFCFSISHTKGYAAISFGNVPSGCDIQIEKDVNFKIAERFYTEKERTFVKDCPKDFFKIWCRKESLYKLSGKNLCTVESLNYTFEDFMPKDGLYLSVCTEKGEICNPQFINVDTVF